MIYADNGIDRSNQITIFIERLDSTKESIIKNEGKLLIKIFLFSPLLKKFHF